MIGPPLGPAPSARVLPSRSRLVPILVPTILILPLLLVLILALLLVLVVLLVVAPPLLRGGPALVGSLVLLLGVKVVAVGGEGVVQVVVEALVGAGVRLLLAGVELQRAVPHSITAVDQEAWRRDRRDQLAQKIKPGKS